MAKSRFRRVLHNMAYGIHTDTNVIVVIHNESEPTDDEWYGHYIPDTQMFAEKGLVSRSVIVSDGGTPNLEQRKALDKLHATLDNGEQTVKIAVVSPVPYLVRIAVMVLNVFFAKNRLRIFETIDAALDWLDLHGEERDGVRDVICDFRSALAAKSSSKAKT